MGIRPTLYISIRSIIWTPESAHCYDKLRRIIPSECHAETVPGTGYRNAAIIACLIVECKN